MAPSRRFAGIALAGLLLACPDEPPREDHRFDRSELLARLAQIQVGVDRVRPLLVALQGKSFQLSTADGISKHVAVVAQRLPERATEEELQAGAVGVNLAGLALDVVRLDAEATFIGLGGVMHRTALFSRDALWPAMDRFAADPTWANEHEEEARRLVYRVAGYRDNAVEALGYAQIARAGVQAASTAQGALGVTELAYGGAVAFNRIIQFMRSGGAQFGKLAVAAEGGGVAALQLVAAGKSIALTEAKIAAMVNAGILSVAAWNLTLMAAGKPKRVDPERFKAWAESLETKAALRGSPAIEYQVKHCGPKEYLARSEKGKQIWADGIRVEDAWLLEAKHVGDPKRSPYISQSGLPEKIKSRIRADQLEKLERYAEVVRDPSSPAVGVEIIVNDPRATKYFEGLLQEVGVSGRVVVKP